MKRAFLLLLPVISGAMLLGGCFFHEEKNTNYYLPVIQTVSMPKSIFLRIGGFANATGGGQNFQFRLDSVRVGADGYHKWLLPPGELTAKLLREALTGKDSSAKGGFFISGAVSTFSADLSRKVFCFRCDYQIEDFRCDTIERVSGTFYTEESIDTGDGEKIAVAAGNAIEKLAVRLGGIVRDMDRTSAADAGSGKKKMRNAK
ncbi:MAG: hypothetical protein PHS41_10260 [Victivallaceae bacterium]|nr:hypothetical protein [Victivallaceae bacterium]